MNFGAGKSPGFRSARRRAAFLEFIAPHLDSQQSFARWMTTRDKTKYPALFQMIEEDGLEKTWEWLVKVKESVDEYDFR
jgi:hypothetical protein